MNIFIPSLEREILYSIGKNAKDNFRIIDMSNENDIWFHLEDYPSSHIIAHISELPKLNKKQFRQIIKQGAVLCKQKSKCYDKTNVNYTIIKNITKTDIIGTVLTSNLKTIYL